MTIQRVPRIALIPCVLLAMLGSGAWPVQSADPPGEKVLFEENFTGRARQGLVLASRNP